MAAAGEEQVKLGRTGLGGNSPEAGWCAVQTDIFDVFDGIQENEIKGEACRR